MTLKRLVAASFETLKANIAPTALHDSAAQFDRPKCHRNTRMAVIKKIMDWMYCTDLETWCSYIMWLTGAAGAGKSAIAQSIIALCLEEGLVIASFFFFRSDESRNHGKQFIATLSYQIFHSVPGTQAAILSAIDNDPLIFTKSLQRQFDALVIQPLCHFYNPLDTKDNRCRRLIVIDGLDECVDKETQTQILNMLGDAIREYKLPVIFLVASRPDHDITTVLNSKPMEGIFARLYLDSTFHPDDDIRTFLEDSFEEIQASHPFKSHMSSWQLTPEALESIVRKSSGQFIYAATIVRFVRSIRHLPHQRLDVVMNLRPANGDLPFAELDALYTFILSSVADIDNRVLYALGVSALRVFLYSPDISAFMSLAEGELEMLFCDLGALVKIEHVLNVPRLHILHASFNDFLLDPERSKEFFIDNPTFRADYVADCLSYALLGKILFSFIFILTSN